MSDAEYMRIARKVANALHGEASHNAIIVVCDVLVALVKQTIRGARGEEPTDKQVYDAIDGGFRVLLMDADPDKEADRVTRKTN